MMYHVIIIGGGLAGLSLSIDLAKRGYRAAVIEKGTYPRHKVCGEYISMESWRYLHALCPDLSSLSLPRIGSFRISSTGRLDFKTPLALGGFGISRFLLEELLYKQALELGVTFCLGTKALGVSKTSEGFEVTTKSQALRASLVCNASGRRSNLEMQERGKKRVATNYVGVKYHVRLERAPELIEIHNFPGGYCGISAIEDGKACLCYIVNAKQLAAVNKSIPELERQILFQNRHLERIFRGASFILKEPVTISGINFDIKEPLNETTFFLGDSAGSIAPVTGNGMSMGLRSSFVLAAQIDSYFQKQISYEQLRKNYSVFWEKEFSSRIRLSRFFQKLSEYPFLTRLTIPVFKLFPALARYVIRLTHGQPF